MGSARLVAIKMTVFYSKGEEDCAPADTVFVCVGEAGPETHGQESGAVLATVKWWMAVPGEDLPILRSEGLFDLGTALDYADVVAHFYGLSRVVVVVGSRGPATGGRPG